MAITPRCSTTDPTIAAATSTSPALTGWTNAGLGVSGTAPAAGDFVAIVGTITAASQTVTQTAGTGTWTVKYSDNNSGGTMTAWVAYRIFDGTETAPTFGWQSSTRHDWVVAAVAPDSGNTISIDVWAASQIDTTAATTHTPNSATAGSTDCSLIFAGAAASAGHTNALAFTAPTNWTLLASSTEQSSTQGQGSAICYRTGVASGSVAPGAETIEGGTSATGTTVANVYHVLLKETTAAAQVYVPGYTRPARPAQAPQRARPAFRQVIVPPVIVPPVRTATVTRLQVRRTPYLPVIAAQSQRGSLIRAVRAPPQPRRVLPAFRPAMLPVATTTPPPPLTPQAMIRAARPTRAVRVPARAFQPAPAPQVRAPARTVAPRVPAVPRPRRAAFQAVVPPAVTPVARIRPVIPPRLPARRGSPAKSLLPATAAISLADVAGAADSISVNVGAVLLAPQVRAARPVRAPRAPGHPFLPVPAPQVRAPARIVAARVQPAARPRRPAFLAVIAPVIVPPVPVRPVRVPRPAARRALAASAVLIPPVAPSLTDAAGAVDALTVTAAVPLADVAGSPDAIVIAAAVPLADPGAAIDAPTITAALPLTDAGGAADGIVSGPVVLSPARVAAVRPVLVPRFRRPAFLPVIARPATSPFTLVAETAPLRWNASPAPLRWPAQPALLRWRIAMPVFPPIAAISRENINVLWTSDLDGTVTVPDGSAGGSAMPVQFAFPVSSGNPAAPAQPVTWYGGTWLAGGTGKGFYAQCSVGPGSGGAMLAAGQKYDVWCQVLGGAEQPAKFCGVQAVY